MITWPKILTPAQQEQAKKDKHGCHDCGALVTVAMLITDTEEKRDMYFCGGCIEQKVKDHESNYSK